MAGIKNDGTPIYQQIVQDFRHKIMTKKMHAHERIPSVRALARELGVNPNTVQKAYRILKAEQLIYSLAGKGDFVADNAEALKEMKREHLIRTFIRATREARDSGMWIDEIISIIDDAYSSD